MEKKKFTISIDLILFIILLMLKLDGIINWKWVWVFSPFWITWIISAVIVLIVAIANFKPKWNSYRVPSGSTLVWDAKTGQLYGPWMNEDSETDKE